MPIWLIILLLFLLLDLVLVLIVVIKRARSKIFTLEQLEYIKAHWIRIIDSFQGNPAASIMDADKLLDYALSKRGFEGNLGEKLKLAGPRFSNINGVWRAHKLRNKIAHEFTNINKKEAKSALKEFKQALNDLGTNL